jgi:hypothetical protein
MKRLRRAGTREVESDQREFLLFAVTDRSLAIHCLSKLFA